MQGLRSNFIGCEFFLESNSPDIIALCETNLDESIYSGNFPVKGYFPLIQKDCVTQGEFLLHRMLIVIYVFDWLYFIQSFISFSSIDHLPCPCEWFFYAISSKIGKVPSINSSANVSVFGNLNFHHKD